MPNNMFGCCSLVFGFGLGLALEMKLKWLRLECGARQCITSMRGLTTIETVSMFTKGQFMLSACPRG